MKEINAGMAITTFTHYTYKELVDLKPPDLF